MTQGPTPDRGAIFVATGLGYSGIVAPAAASLRAACPGLAVDLFTDAESAEARAEEFTPLFDRVHVLDRVWRRSKIDGMALSRFPRTLYLDADLRVTADLRDVFDLLDRFDLALAHDQWRNAEVARILLENPLPDAFPQFNSGVIAYRQGPALQTLFADWRAAAENHSSGRDQPALRELLWRSDLRIAALPPEYNLMDWAQIETWGDLHPGPRVIHSPRFHKHVTHGMGALSGLQALTGPRLGERLSKLIAADRGLAERAGRARAPFRDAPLPRRALWALRSAAGELRRALRPAPSGDAAMTEAHKPEALKTKDKAP